MGTAPAGVMGPGFFRSVSGVRTGTLVLEKPSDRASRTAWQFTRAHLVAPESKSPIKFARKILPGKSARKICPEAVCNTVHKQVYSPARPRQKRENSREAARIVAGIRDSVKFCRKFCCLVPFKVCVL